MHQVITKFGGTSVSSRTTWDYIVHITKQHIASDAQPIIVCSALTQASNQLEQLIEAALTNHHHALIQQLMQNYFALTQELDVDPMLIHDDFKQLEKWLTGIALLKEAPGKTHAQILSLGELM